MKRTVLCIQSVWLDEQRALPPTECQHLSKPDATAACNRDILCPAQWTIGNWSEVRKPKGKEHISLSSLGSLKGHLDKRVQGALGSAATTVNLRELILDSGGLFITALTSKARGPTENSLGHRYILEQPQQ